MPDAQADVLSAKSEVIAGRNPDWFTHKRLVESWRRCASALGDSKMIASVPTVPESWLDDTALELLREPLEVLRGTLSDTGAALLLTDAQGWALASWFQDRSAGKHLDSVGSQRAADLRESKVGTNAVNLALGATNSAAVVGAEHFSDFFAHSACVAEPVRDPLSGSVIAVIALTAPVTPRIDLMRGWLTSVRTLLIAHLAQRLSRPSSLRVEDTEEWALRQALTESSGDIARTCELLGLSRATVYRRIRRYRISTTGPSSD